MCVSVKNDRCEFVPDFESLKKLIMFFLAPLYVVVGYFFTPNNIRMEALMPSIMGSFIRLWANKLYMICERKEK